MKISSFVISLILFSGLIKTQISFAQCNIPRLLTQADVDEFVSNNPDCTEANFSLNIGYSSFDEGISDIHDLSGLSNLTRIGGNLYIGKVDSLISIAGLENIKYIKGDLYVRGNPKLRNLSALGNLDTIGGKFFVKTNDSLETIAEFNNLSYIGKFIEIDFNRNIKTIGSFEGINLVNGQLSITSMPLVEDLSAFKNIQSINGSLSIGRLGISDCSGLNSLQEVKGQFGNIYIDNNPELISLNGLDNLARVEQNFIIDDIPNLTSIEAIENLTSISGFIRIKNTRLTNLIGLQNVHIGEKIQILNNKELQTLYGLSLDQSLSSHVIIEGNSKLTDISALSSLDSILGDLNIIWNNALEDCDPICNIIQNGYIGGDITINNNLTGCDTPEEITSNSSCTTSINETKKDFYQLSPNPAKDYLTIRYKNQEYNGSDLPIIHDIYGHKYHAIIDSKKNNELRLNIHSLKSGIYFIQPINEISTLYRFIKN